MLGVVSTEIHVHSLEVCHYCYGNAWNSPYKHGVMDPEYVPLSILCCHPGKDAFKVLRSWNAVDGLLVTVCRPHDSLANSGNIYMQGILKFVCLLRTILPLRVINQGPKLKLAVEALISSSKPTGDIALISWGAAVKREGLLCGSRHKKHHQQL